MLDKTNILLAIVVVILLMCNLILYNNKFLTPASDNQKVIQEYNQREQNIIAQNTEIDEEQARMSDEEIADEKLTDLKSMGEADRMYTYVGDFFSKIEAEDYEEAYNRLYDDFKQQYFPTLDNFSSYVQKTYPAFISLQYDGIERQGEYYIVTVTIKSSVSSLSFSNVQQKIILF